MGVAASKQEAFWEACGFGHIERVKKFLTDSEIDVNWVSYTHDSCAIHVASQSNTEIVKLLLEAKCDVNVKDIRGNLALHHAAIKGNVDILKLLIDAKSEINSQDKNGWTALHCASYWGHYNAVKLLVDSGANIHVQNKDERTPLHETARSQETKQLELGRIAELLIAAGSDVDAKSSDLGEADFTGLMFASYHDHPEVVQAFIKAGCDINASGTNLWTALHWAADKGNDEIVYILLEAGADPTLKGMRGELAADRAQNLQMKEDLMNAVNMFKELQALERKAEKNVNIETKKETTKNRTTGKTENKKDVDIKSSVEEEKCTNPIVVENAKELTCTKCENTTDSCKSEQIGHPNKSSTDLEGNEKCCVVSDIREMDNICDDSESNNADNKHDDVSAICMEQKDDKEEKTVINNSKPHEHLDSEDLAGIDSIVDELDLGDD